MGHCVPCGPCPCGEAERSLRKRDCADAQRESPRCGLRYYRASTTGRNRACRSTSECLAWREWHPFPAVSDSRSSGGPRVWLESPVLAPLNRGAQVHGESPAEKRTGSLPAASSESEHYYRGLVRCRRGTA